MGHSACVEGAVNHADSFIRGGPNLITFFFLFFFDDEWRKDQNTTISGSSSARQRKPLKWRFSGVPNIECWIGSFVIFKGTRTSIAKKPYIFVIYQGGYGPPVSTSRSAHDVGHTGVRLG